MEITMLANQLLPHLVVKVYPFCSGIVKIPALKNKSNRVADQRSVEIQVVEAGHYSPVV